MRKYFLQFGFLCLLILLINGVSTAQAHKPEVLKIMTYNVHHCNPPEASNKIDVVGTALVIKAQSADIVALQEIDVNTGRSGHIDEAKLLAQKAGYPYYHFSKAMNFDGGEYGILILSKYPIKDTATILLPKAKGNNTGEQRVLSLANIVLPSGKTIRFGCTHLEAFHKNSRLLQAQKMAQIARLSKTPMIVCGDMNAEEKSKTIQTLDKVFDRSCHNCPPTFWEDGATGAIDYILFSKHKNIKALSHQVINNKQASDHMPVVAVLEVD